MAFDRRSGGPHEFARLNLIGDSPQFQETLRLIVRYSTCDAAVLIQGEPGTGKELAARAIHYLGPRRDAPFIPVNCGAIPDSLIESEFFGHARGAFTDAKESRVGVIEQAHGGTLYLDELEALTPRAQVVLLRFLQDHVYRPVGSSIGRTANIRIVGSSNVDLQSLAERGEYRSDLLFRLSVLTIDLPPLRERAGDPAILAARFLTRFSAQYRTEPRPLSAASQVYLDTHRWPGNVRELENLVHRACVLSEGAEIAFPGVTADHVTSADSSPLSFNKAKAAAIAQFERTYLSELLRRTGGNISKAARLCGKERSRLGKLVKKHGLQPRHS
jgi:DNA-binding NtrC family response regulator